VEDVVGQRMGGYMEWNKGIEKKVGDEVGKKIRK